MPTRAFPMALLALAALLPFAHQGSAADWPQYRGPDRSGQIGEPGLLQSWEEESPTEIWRREIGTGFSAIAIANGRLFTMEAVGSEEAILAMDAASGETLWRTVVGETPPELFPDIGPRSTPTVVDGMVYAASAAARLLALSSETGETLWDHDLAAYGPMPRYGYSMSPLVDGDQVLALVGDREKTPGVIAFDRRTGEVRWQALDGPAGYSSPIVVELHGLRQYVFATFTAIVGLTTEGEVLWSHDTGPKAALPMPIFVAPDKIFVATADDHFGGMMIRVARDDDGFATEELWRERLMRNHFNTSVAVGGYLYGFDNATLRCLDVETGEKKWAHRGFGKGSIVSAGSLLYLLGDNGTLALAHASPEAYREAGRTKPMTGRSWTTPSLADGRLYVRDFDELVSLDVSGDSGGSVATPSSATPARPLEVARFGPDGLSVDEIIARHIEARGGAERWRSLEGLALEGIYTAFSEESDFTLVRSRDNQYRLDFELLGRHAIRARDSTGSWWQHALLQPEPARLTEGPYKTQLERESLFGPLLLDYQSKDIEVELIGQGELDGRATIDLKLTLPHSQEETWRLDAHTFLEVAIDSQVFDFTQFADATGQRAFYSDFRDVGGLVIPFRVDLEFGARLEEMLVAKVTLNPEIDPEHLEAPPPPPEEEITTQGKRDEGAEEGRGDG